MALTVKKYRQSRHFALYDGHDLVCVTLYKKGAREVKRRLEIKDQQRFYEKTGYIPKGA